MKKLTPSFKSWVVGDCKWVVGFPTGRRYFKTEQLAWDEINTFLAGRMGKLKPAEEEEYRAARDLLSDLGVTVLQAARFYVEHAPRVAAITVGEAVTAYLAKKKPRVGELHFDSLERSLRYLRDYIGPEVKVCPLIYVKAAAFLNAQAEGTRRGRAAHVAGLLNSLEEQAPKAAKKMMEIVSLDERDEAPDPHFLSYTDAAIVLHYVRSEHPDWLGAVALKLFTGIRSFEVGRLRWRDVDLEQRVVRIGSEVAKKTRGRKARRVIDWWPDCLNDWLMLVKRQPETLVAPENQLIRRHRDGFDPESLSAQRRFAVWISQKLKPESAELGVEIRNNDFRHTYATYGVAFHQSADLVALQMGHGDSRMLFSHYRNWTSQREAKDFFVLTPQKAEQIFTERLNQLNQANQNHG